MNWHDFYSHALARRDVAQMWPARYSAYFYSHALARRDQTFDPATGEIYISTPTPSQGVTEMAEAQQATYNISTPTPSQGVTAWKP